MIFIGNLEKITDTKEKIGFIHYDPFNEKYGLHKTKEELQKQGVFVDNIPKEEQEGKTAELFYNPVTNECFYEYSDAPKGIPSLEEQINSLGQIVTEEKMKNLQKDKIISSLGTQLAEIKMLIIKLQGGNN